MVKVPTYQQDVATRPIFQQSVDVRANANDFGAQIGAGMRSVASGMGQVADSLAAVRDMEDALRAKEADNNLAAWARERMYGAGGFMTLEGKSAVDGRAAFDKELQEQRLAFGKDLRGGASQKYAVASQARVNSMFEQTIVHEANQRKQWFKDSSVARLDTFAEDAIAGYTTPKKVEINIAAGQAEIRQQAQMLGWDVDTTRNREAEYISTVRMGVVNRLMNADPVAAKAYFDLHKSEFTGPHQSKVDEALKTPLLNEQVKRHTAEFFNGAASTAQPAPVPGPGQSRGPAGENASSNNADAAAAIRGFEGFKTTPYWDVNAYRVGYGSDTITKADGTVVRVQPGMTVTREDAERDLSRRINQEFVPGIIRDVGPDAWANMPAPARAALASVAYNYGSLPRTVADAVRGGDVGAVAAAVANLRGHNNGVNANRRDQEAAIIGGVMGIPAASAGSMPGFGDIEKYLSGITNATERELTRKAIYGALEDQNKAVKAQREAAQAQAFNLIETQNVSPFSLPASVTTAIGQDGMSSLMTYWEKRSKGEPITTDQTKLYELQTQYATNPQEFAKLNLLEYKNVLSDADFKTVTDWRQTALTDQRKAREDGLNLTAAFSQSTDALDAVGITASGKKGSQADEAHKRIAAFNNALAMQMDEFKRKEQRAPDQVQIQSMINRLLLPIVLKTKGGGLFGFDKTEDGKFLFEAPRRSDAATIDVAVKYEDVPADLRRGIALDLERELGRKPSNDEVVQRYEEFRLSQ